MGASSTNKPDPKLCHHKAVGQSYVRLNGKQHYLGATGDPATVERYHALLATWHANGGTLPPPPEDCTVTELAVAYFEFAKTRYVDKRTGKPSARAICVQAALKVLRELYGSTRCAGFEAPNLYAVQTRMKKRGWSRTTINDRVGTIKLMFKWGSRRGMIPGGVTARLADVENVQAHDRDVPGPRKIFPVGQADYEAALPHMSPPVAAACGVMWWTGMRPGEVCVMRPVDIDRSGAVWVYRPRYHKTEHKGQRREIPIGPKAQAVLEVFLDRDPQAHCFSPVESYAWVQHQRNINRQTPLGQGNRIGTNRKKSRAWEPRTYFDTGGLGRHIAGACKRAGVAVWTPNRLRHSAATRISEEFGLVEASLMLGHSHAELTAAVYAERSKRQLNDLALRAG